MDDTGSALVLTDITLGDRLEARDCRGTWYAAKVVDTRGLGAEREVKVHFMNWSKRWDEWIAVESGRLRDDGAGLVDETVDADGTADYDDEPHADGGNLPTGPPAVRQAPSHGSRGTAATSAANAAHAVGQQVSPSASEGSRSAAHVNARSNSTSRRQLSSVSPNGHDLSGPTLSGPTLSGGRRPLVSRSPNGRSPLASAEIGSGEAAISRPGSRSAEPSEPHGGDSSGASGPYDWSTTAGRILSGGAFMITGLAGDERAALEATIRRAGGCIADVQSDGSGLALADGCDRSSGHASLQRAIASGQLVVLAEPSERG